MKLRNINTLLLLAFAGLLFFSFKVDKQTYSLKVKVNGLKSNKGQVQYALYNKQGTIPDEKYKNYYLLKTNSIINNQSAIVFKNLPAGTYAVNILHDEDKDGEIDKGWILPIEGIGFSNINKIGLGNKPNFTKASFELTANKAIEIKVIYL